MNRERERKKQATKRKKMEKRRGRTERADVCTDAKGQRSRGTMPDRLSPSG
jgi:hypothetical protein